MGPLRAPMGIELDVIYVHNNLKLLLKKRTCWGNMQPLENAFALTHCFAKMCPCLHSVSRERIRTHSVPRTRPCSQTVSRECACAYIRCRQNPSVLLLFWTQVVPLNKLTLVTIGYVAVVRETADSDLGSKPW